MAEPIRPLRDQGFAPPVPPRREPVITKLPDVSGKHPLRAVATWKTWDEPERDIAVAKWLERDLAFVFPLTWAAHHGQAEMIARAKERLAEVEAKAEKPLLNGSVLLAFSSHTILTRDQAVTPGVSRNLFLSDGVTPY